MRANDDFPDALGPITPSALPRWSLSESSRTTVLCSPGGITLALSTTSVLCGASRGIGSLSAGILASNSRSRPQLCRAATQLRQCAIAMSTGASARALSMEPAMMMPAEACW
jgi:hypothetical protein